MSHTSAISPESVTSSPLGYDARPETVIVADQRDGWWQALREVLSYRELFWALTLRDLKVRYKQTALGIAWVVLQPLFTGGVLALIFSRFRSGQDAGAIEAMLFYLAALVPWNSFAQGVYSASVCMESEANLISKVYFPRIIVPTARVLASSVDFGITIVVLLLAALFTGYFTWGLLLAIPGLLLIQMLSACGIGYLVGILNAQYRDVKYVIPFLLQSGLLVSVLLSLEDWPAWLQPWLRFNPMAAVIETYRALVSHQPIDWPLVALGTMVSILLFVFGAWVFRRRETYLADVL
ncbi:Transport permease protein [Planctomycetales bacterium 10988]|nr:Transport permease protein [Planctomycetales bacterium 10988]